MQDSFVSKRLVSDLTAQLRALEYDVAYRNAYMNRRDRYIYGDGLYEKLSFPDGFDKTLYNWCERIVDIHTAQAMGKGFAVHSWYQKEDLSIYQPTDTQGLQAAELANKQKKLAADIRKRHIDAIIRDNGGYDLFKLGARTGSAYGITVYKAWYDPKAVKYNISLLEAPQNYRAGWADTNFRDRDWDAYVYQISIDKAYQLYGDKLKPGETWEITQEGYPLGTPLGNTNTSDPLDQNTSSLYPTQTQRPMVTVIDFTGRLTAWGAEGQNPVQRARGKEDKMSLLIVGGKHVQTISDPKLLPKYYVIDNRKVPRRAWGHSDLSNSFLDINTTFVEKMSDYISITNKSLFPMIQAKGFTTGSIPPKQQRKMQVVPMGVEQSLEAVNLPQTFGMEYERLLAELKEQAVRQSGVGSVLFDDPTVNLSSNAALLTTMKSVQDIVNDKHDRWSPVLEQMFTDALYTIAQFDKDFAQQVNTNDNWFLYIVWPPLLEDPAYQTMLINDLHSGAISIDTYMEKRGMPDVSEELDRIRDAMKDPIRASIMGGMLKELAQFTIYESLGVPLSGFNVPKISIKGDLTPQQEGNLGQTYGWNDGPFGASIGPQGNEGEKVDDDAINQGFTQNDPYAQSHGIPAGMTPGQPLQPGQQPNPQGAQPAGAQPTPFAPSGPAAQGAPGPILTPGQNQTPQPMSQPGSGASTSSAAGAVAAHKQRSGR